MTIYKYVTEEDREYARQFIRNLEEGTIRRRGYPEYEGKPFDEEKALENAEALIESGIFDRLIRDAYNEEQGEES